MNNTERNRLLLWSEIIIIVCLSSRLSRKYAYSSQQSNRGIQQTFATSDTIK